MLNLKKLLTKVLNWFASGSNQQILSEGGPPSSATYGSRIRLRGNGLSGTAGTSDTYWLGIDSNGTFYTGTQLNQASSITWQIVPAGVADYIVEIGSSSYWRWVKYNSGEFDMWVTWSGTPDGGTGTHYTTVNGFYGYYSAGYTFPSGCKPIDANYQITTEWVIGSGFTMDCGAAMSRTTTGFNLYALATAGNVTTITLRSHIHGRWK